jgi:predicted acylesterase/phospholipase RssA
MEGARVEPQSSQQSAETLPHECDVVMKGGITSGVIYPRLVSQLSKVYTLRSIGGTSAGAIAAAAAAAAQLGVAAGSAPDAFTRLERLPAVLGESVAGLSGSRLLHLFQPRAQLRRHFAVLMAGLNVRAGATRLARVLGSLEAHFPLGGLFGAVPGAVLLATSTGIGRWISTALVLLGAVVGALTHALLSLFRNLPQAGFGLCDGMCAPDEEPQALTPWLHGYLNELAGKGLGEPLTFGELWAGQLRARGAPSPYTQGNSKSIQLAMVTTALNLRRPFLLPFESNDIYFCEQELRKLFPLPVADWMVQHARPSVTANRLSAPERRILALPVADDLPVLFAVRLSLSFPLLLSAIPLYGVDRTLKANAEKATVLTRVYFSDGGICSNFPVYFFDAPLPSRPTFGVDLRDFHPEHLDRRVWLPEVLRNNQGLKTYIPPLLDVPGFSSVVGFLSSILETMQNWRDQMQLVMPGFRDRIVHVSHSSDEGGLNLDMPRDVIERLGNAGVDAAQALIDAFEKPGSEGWANHRRIRLRTLVGAIQKQLDALAKALSAPDEPTWETIALDERPPSYPFRTEAEREGALKLLRILEKASQELLKVDLDSGSPQPRPEWRATPKI